MATVRSIGARSDFEDGSELLETRSVYGADDHDHVPDPRREAEVHEANIHLSRYVTDQLERVRTDREHDGVGDVDEFETRP